MLNQRRLIIAVIFYFILLFFNVIYFYIYFSLLDFSFTWLHLFFVSIATLSYFLMFNFLRFRWWRALSLLFLGAVYLVSLFNFAYFGVFKSFVDFSMRQASQLDLSMITFLQDFASLVPVKLYVLAIVVYSAAILNSIVYLLIIDKKVEHLLFNSQPLKLIFHYKKRPMRNLVFLIVVFAIINTVAFSTCSYLYNNPRETWWDIKKQLSDVGFLGHFYSQLYANAKNKDDNQDDDRTALQVAEDSWLEIKKFNPETESQLYLPKFKERPNILVVQLESVGSWAVDNDPSPMPYLKKLMQNNVTIGDFHANSCETINAEFASLCSFWPNSFEPIGYSHKENKFNCLPEILKDDYNYSTHFFHSNVPEFWDRETLIPRWGFDNTYFAPDLRQKLNDDQVFQRALTELNKESKPFFGYVLSFTSHAPHDQEQIDYQLDANNLEIKPFVGKINPWLVNSSEINEEQMRLFFGFLKSSDDALENLMISLKNKGLDKNTIVVIYSDHRYYSFDGSNEQLVFDSYNQLPMTIVFPQGFKGEIVTQASHMDISPTILNLIEQSDYVPRENFWGTSLFTKQYNSPILNKCLGKIYFKNQDLIIQGNAKSDIYRVMTSKENLSTVEEKLWIKLISDLVKSTDEVLEQDVLVE